MSAESDPLKPVTVTAPPEEEEALCSQVCRVQASGVLGEARLRRLFDYLAEKSLAGQSPKEIAIAMDVFGKGSDFDVSQDALVRVYIHKLRKALDEYYASSGGGSGPALHIPRGEYRLKVSAKAPDRTSDQNPDGNPEVLVPPIPPKGRAFQVLRTAALLGAALILGAFAMWLWTPRSDLDRVDRKSVV